MSQTAPCSTCGKPVIVRNVHDVRRRLPNYCNRVCESNSRYANTRYQEAPDHERISPGQLMKRGLNE